jgi:hypothetical protein
MGLALVFFDTSVKEKLRLNHQLPTKLKPVARVIQKHHFYFEFHFHRVLREINQANLISFVVHSERADL